MHSIGLYSAAGTCFSAAAWMTIVDAAHRLHQAVPVAHVADEVAHAAGASNSCCHLVLLQLVARVDDEALRLVPLEQRRDDTACRTSRCRR